MAQCIFDRATKRFVRGARWDPIAHDPATEVLLDLPDFPRADQMWDGGTGLRQATIPELVAAADADKDLNADRELDLKIMRAFGAELLQVLETRTPLAGALNRTMFWAGVKARLKALL